MLRLLRASAALALFAGTSPIAFCQANPANTLPATAQPVNPLGQWLGWLSAPQIQAELEILPEQRDELVQLRSEMMGKVNERYQEIATGAPEERQQKYLELSQGFAAETDKKVSDVLLPHQLQRLRQIALQLKLSGGAAGAATGGAFDGGEVAEVLGITPEQQAKLREKQQEIREEMQQRLQEFYRQVQAEAREELLSVLTPEQRKKLDDLIGPKFEWQQQASRGAERGTPASGKP